MKRLVLTLVTSSVLALAGCGRSEAPTPAPTAAPPAKAAQDAPPASPPPPPMPPPANTSPAEASTPSPKPGQANDHSNPEFKDGGKK